MFIVRVSCYLLGSTSFSISPQNLPHCLCRVSRTLLNEQKRVYKLYNRQTPFLFIAYIFKDWIIVTFQFDYRTLPFWITHLRNTNLTVLHEFTGHPRTQCRAVISTQNGGRLSLTPKKDGRTQPWDGARGELICDVHCFSILKYH